MVVRKSSSCQTETVVDNFKTVWQRTYTFNVTAIHKIAESGRRNQVVYKTHPIVKSRQISLNENMTRQSFIKNVLSVHDLEAMYVVGEARGPVVQIWFYGT